jgi:hypothetical protein
LIADLSRSDRRGWSMGPADMHYRLTRWYQVEITREELAEVLRTGAHLTR